MKGNLMLRKYNGTLIMNGESASLLDERITTKNINNQF